MLAATARRRSPATFFFTFVPPLPRSPISTSPAPATRQRNYCIHQACPPAAFRIPMSGAPVLKSPRTGCAGTGSFSAAPSRAPPMLTLTEQEAAIFELLSRVRVEEGLEDLTLRVAGGWVRDKVLGKVMNDVDIDIALDTLLGREFAEVVNGWMKKNEMECHSVGVIAKNPDQSKHLETATMMVLDTWLDLVNLRTETYSHDSRIPDMDIGTPLEDALRRDLTINALFYNINTSTVEDLTGKGLEDLRQGIIRTPLPPLTTLLDDPLRALRAIRFASRLNFRFDKELFEACKHPEVHEALDKKVSRERIYSELNGIMKSDRPTHALGLLVELGLFNIVFRAPTGENVYVNNERPPDDLAAISLGKLLSLETLWSMADDGSREYTPAIRRLATPPADTRIAAFAAVLMPLSGISVAVGKKKKNKKGAPLVQYVCGEELRMATKDVTDIINIHTAAHEFKKLVQVDQVVDRLTSGLVMRAVGPKWKIALQMALIDSMKAPQARDSYAAGFCPPADISKPQDTNNTIANYAKYMQCIENEKLEGVWDTKPIINGNDMLRILPRLQKGKIVGDIMKKQIEFQIQNPNAGIEETTQWLTENYSGLA